MRVTDGVSDPAVDLAAMFRYTKFNKVNTKNAIIP